MATTQSQPISEAFMLLAELAIARKEEPIKNKMWIVRLDKYWVVAVNGYFANHDTGNLPGSGCNHNIPPCTAYIEFNGWPAGEINPYGGWIAGGDVANEDTFCEAVRQAIAKAKA